MRELGHHCFDVARDLDVGLPEHLGEVVAAESAELQRRRALRPRDFFQQAGDHRRRVAHGEDRDDRTRREGAERAAQHERRITTEPLQVVDDEQCGTACREGDDAKDGFEYPGLRLVVARGGDDGVGRVEQLRDHAGQIGAAHTGSDEHGRVVAHDRGDELRQRCHRRHRVTRATRRQHREPEMLGKRGGFGGQPGLADPRLTGHDQRRSGAGGRLMEVRFDDGHLGDPPDERGRRTVGGPSPPSCGWSMGRGRLAQERDEGGLRLRRRAHTELVVEQPAAAFVRVERGRPVPGGLVRHHQESRGPLVEGVERERVDGERDRVVDLVAGERRARHDESRRAVHDARHGPATRATIARRRRRGSPTATRVPPQWRYRGPRDASPASRSVSASSTARIASSTSTDTSTSSSANVVMPRTDLRRSPSKPAVTSAARVRATTFRAAPCQ